MASAPAPSDWRSHVVAIVDDPPWLDRLVVVANETLSATPGWSVDAYPEAAIREAVRGFTRVLKEALEGRTGETRRMFMETAIPAFVEAGQSPESLVTAAATYLVLIADALVTAVPEAHRRETLKWMASFAGLYVSDVCASASRSAR